MAFKMVMRAALTAEDLIRVVPLVQVVLMVCRIKVRNLWIVVGHVNRALHSPEV